MSAEQNDSPVEEPTENSAATDLHPGNPDNPGPATDPETVSDAMEESRPDDAVTGTDDSTDDEVVEQSETVGEDAAEEESEDAAEEQDELTPEEEEAGRRRDIQRNFAGNMGKKSERKRQTNEPDDG